MKKFFTSMVVFFLPSFLLRPLLRFMGHEIGKKVKIGFSIMYFDRIKLGNHTTIGHLNLFLNDKISSGKECKIGYLNIFKGPFDINMEDNAAIGNKNYLTRAKKGITYGHSELFLGKWTKVTVKHHLDLTRSITFGKYSILAGINSQMWTHGYYHADTGLDRIRIDGPIKVGDNVYVGSSSIFNPGVTVGSSIHLGAGTVVAKNLSTPGMYVNQGLRFIDNNIEKVKARLKPIEGEELIEKVYLKE